MEEATDLWQDRIRYYDGDDDDDDDEVQTGGSAIMWDETKKIVPHSKMMRNRALWKFEVSVKVQFREDS